MINEERKLLSFCEVSGKGKTYLSFMSLNDMWKVLHFLILDQNPSHDFPVVSTFRAEPNVQT